MCNSTGFVGVGIDNRDHVGGRHPCPDSGRHHCCPCPGSSGTKAGLAPWNVRGVASVKNNLPVKQAGNERRNTMPLINLVIVLAVVGLILWAINSYIPMQATIKKILNAVVVISVIVWLLSVFGIIGSIQGIRIG
jgi:hypothetical protein